VREDRKLKKNCARVNGTAEARRAKKGVKKKKKKGREKKRGERRGKGKAQRCLKRVKKNWPQRPGGEKRRQGRGGVNLTEQNTGTEPSSDHKRRAEGEGKDSVPSRS